MQTEYFLLQRLLLIESRQNLYPISKFQSSGSSRSFYSQYTCNALLAPVRWTKNQCKYVTDVLSP